MSQVRLLKLRENLKVLRKLYGKQNHHELLKVVSITLNFGESITELLQQPC